MASSSVVGILRVLLSADTAEYQKDMAKSASAAQTFAKDVKAAGAQSEAVAAAMNKAFTKAEEGTKGLGRAISSLAGIDAIEKANTYAKAVEAIGGVSKLTAAEQSKVNAIVGEASAKYAALGRDAPASLTALANATKAVEQPTSRLSGFMGDLTGQVKATALGFISAQAVIGGVQAGFHALVGFVTESISAYSEQESAVKRMTVALAAQGQATPRVIDDYGRMAEQFQKTTVNSDELINEMQALLVQVGDVMPADMERALQAATDLSSGLGIDLRTATMLVGKAFEGETGTLKKYGIVIDETKLKTEGASAVLEAIQAKFGGQAQAEAETYAGKIKQLANAWNELQEATGKVIVDDPTLQFAIRSVTEALQAQTSETDDGILSWGEYLRGQPGLIGMLARSKQALDETAESANALHAALTLATRNAPTLATSAPARVSAETTAQIAEQVRLGKEDAKAQEAAARAAEAHAKSIRSLMDAFSGATKIRAALDATEAYNRNLQAGIGISKMSVEQQDQLNEALEGGVEAYKLLGREAPRSLIAAYTETFRLDRLLDEFEPKLTPIASGLQGIGQVIEAGVVPPVQAWQLIMDKLLKDLDKLPPNFLQVTAVAAPTFDSVRVKAERAGAAIAEIGHGIQDIGRMIPGVAGLIINAFGEMASAVGGLQSAFEQAENSQHEFAMKAVASATFAIGAYQQMVSIAEKLTGDLGAGEFWDAINSRGGRSQVQTSGMMAGFNTQVLLTTRDADSFRGQLDRFDRAVKASNDRLQKYGLTWMDLGDSIQQANIDQLTRDLVADFRALGNAGVDVDKRITAMSGGLSQLVVDAVTTGQQIPVALQPMLETLIRSGKLSEEAARALLGMSGEAVVSFKDVEDAAKRYGIEIDRLGPKIKQLKINDIAAQIIKDWELLQSAGADTNTTLVGMQRSVQDLVTEALKAGVKIPEGMRPIIQAMIDAGLLTDEFGDKLTDISGIEFEKPITAAIEDLISALDRLIDKLSGVGDEAIRTRGELEKIGDAVPRGTTGTGTGTGDTHPNDPKPEPGPARPRPAPQFPGDDGRRFAHGGIVGRVLSFPSPRGADRVPVMASEGEAFLNVPAVQAIGKPAIDALNRGWQMPIPSGPQAAPGPSQAGDVILNLSLAGATFKDANDAAAQGRAFGEAFLKEVHKGGTIRTQFKDEVTSVMRSA